MTWKCKGCERECMHHMGYPDPTISHDEFTARIKDKEAPCLFYPDKIMKME